METILLDGKALSARILSEQKALISEKQLHPQLIILQVGNNPASEQYVALKKKRGDEIGVNVTVKQLPESTTFAEIKKIIEMIKSEGKAGILIQLPLPEHLETQKTLDLVPPELDCDGLTTFNLSRLSTGNAQFAPAVAVGVMTFLESYDINVSKKSVVVLGKGIYVGKPIAEMIEQKYETIVTRIDVNTPNPKDLIKNANIVISCIGRPHLYSVQDMKQNAVLIDVGTSVDPATGKIVGDFDKSAADGYLSAYTPVPGGVGPMTVASLLSNVVKAVMSNE